jgi:hypothetical protein
LFGWYGIERIFQNRTTCAPGGQNMPQHSSL